MSNEQLAEELIAFRESQAKLERFTSLESDLMQLLTELSKHSKVEERPSNLRPPIRTEQITADPPFPVNQQDKIYTVAKSTTESRETENTQGYFLRLGYFVTAESAQALSNQFSNRIDMNTHGVGSKVVDKAGQQNNMHAVLIGPFNSQWGADAFCSVLQNYGHYCVLDTTYSRM